MSCQIEQDNGATLVVLDAEILIQHATEFYKAVLPLGSFDGAVRIDASAAKMIHTSIMQILYALAQAAPDFAVTAASPEFRAAEIRVGLFFARNKPTQSFALPSGTA